MKVKESTLAAAEELLGPEKGQVEEFLRELAAGFLADLLDTEESGGGDESYRAAEYVRRAYGEEPPERLRGEYPDLDLEGFFGWLAG